MAIYEHLCGRPGCTKWGCFGFGKVGTGRMVWRCPDHRADIEGVAGGEDQPAPVARPVRNADAAADLFGGAL